MRHTAIFAIILLLNGCTTSSVITGNERITSKTLEHIQNAISEKETTTIADLIDRSTPLSDHEYDIEINEESAHAISIDNYKVLARSFQADGIDQLNISSYIIQVPNAPDYLFFPVLSAYNKNGDLLEKVEPLEDYSIEYGVLKAVFPIPPTTSTIIIHTEEKYLKIASMDGQKGGLSPNKSYTNGDIGIAIGALAGGAIGGIIAGAIAANNNDIYNNSPPENYFFGPGGVVDIKSIKKKSE